MAASATAYFGDAGDKWVVLEPEVKALDLANIQTDRKKLEAKLAKEKGYNVDTVGVIDGKRVMITLYANGTYSAQIWATRTPPMKGKYNIL